MVKAYPGHRDALIALVASDEFQDAAHDHIQRYDAAAHVLMLVKQFGPVDTWPGHSHGDSTGSGLESGQVGRQLRRATSSTSPGLVAGPRACVTE